MRIPAASPLADKLRETRPGVKVELDNPRSWAHRDVGPEEREALAALGAELLLPLAVKDRLLGFISLGPKQSEELVALDEALSRLAQFDPRQGRIVELRFFGGLTEEECAEVLGISGRTVKREWRVAKAWLYGELKRGG